jgi:O-Antigen ligase
MAADLASSVQDYRDVLERRSRLWVMVTAALSAIVGGLVLAFPPGWLAVVLCAGIAFAMITWHRPVVGIAIVLGTTILVEQFDFASFRPVTELVPLFENVSHFTGLKGVETSPLEILLMVVALVVVLKAVPRSRRIHTNPLAVPVFIFFVALGTWLVFGLVSGGQTNIALWELRSLAYFCLLIFVVPQVIESQRDVSLLLWVAIAAVGVKAIQGLWNYTVVLGSSLSDVRSITGHEDALFIAWMVVLLVVLVAYRAAVWQRIALIALGPVMAFTFVMTDRRAAYVALVLGLMVVGALLATDVRKRGLVVKTMLITLLLSAFVVGLGWNDSGLLGHPARVVKSVVAPDNKEDEDSSYYRRAEEVNLMHTIESNPVAGLGFGRPFQFSGQGGIVDVGFSLENVIPHDEILWIWAKMGTAGFALFWVMIGSMIAFGGVVFRTARSPYLKSVAALVTAAVVMQIMVSYVDLQLTYARNMVFLAVLLGILARIPALEESEADSVHA